MRAAVPTAIPIALIAEMILITLCDFLAKRYLRAIYGSINIIYKATHKPEFSLSVFFGTGMNSSDNF